MKGSRHGEILKRKKEHRFVSYWKIGKSRFWNRQKSSRMKWLLIRSAAASIKSRVRMNPFFIKNN